MAEEVKSDERESGTGDAKNSVTVKVSFMLRLSAGFRARVHRVYASPGMEIFGLRGSRQRGAA